MHLCFPNMDWKDLESVARAVCRKVSNRMLLEPRLVRKYAFYAYGGLQYEYFPTFAAARKFIGEWLGRNNFQPTPDGWKAHEKHFFQIDQYVVIREVWE